MVMYTGGSENIAEVIDLLVDPDGKFDGVALFAGGAPRAEFAHLLETWRPEVSYTLRGRVEQVLGIIDASAGELQAALDRVKPDQVPAAGSIPDDVQAQAELAGSKIEDYREWLRPLVAMLPGKLVDSFLNTAKADLVEERSPMQFAVGDVAAMPAGRKFDEILRLLKEEHGIDLAGTSPATFLRDLLVGLQTRAACEAKVSAKSARVSKAAQDAETRRQEGEQSRRKSQQNGSRDGNNGADDVMQFADRS